MARPAPGPLPRTLPSLAEASKLIEHWANAPRMRLGDLSIRQLVETYGDGTPVWLTGSTVWMPAVFGLPPPEGNDVDLIFADRKACENFVSRVLGELNRRIPGYTYTRDSSRLGASRIVFPKKPVTLTTGYRGIFSRLMGAEEDKPDTVLDAWHLEPGESVAELLLAYRDDYQRCAYWMSRSVAGSEATLTRVVKPVKKASFGLRY